MESELQEAMSETVVGEDNLDGECFKISFKLMGATNALNLINLLSFIDSYFEGRDSRERWVLKTNSCELI